MSKTQKVLTTSESAYRITINNEAQDLDDVFAQFKEDFRNLPNLENDLSKNFLAPTSVQQIKTPQSKIQEKKRMKLIDYIYIKNTTKKNQHSSKILKAGLSEKELRKSRMKEGKEKAFRSIVDEMISQLKQISGQALAMADLANQSLTYTGNTDQIAKLCNIRRILKDSIMTNMTEIQKLMGVEKGTMMSKSRQKIQEEEQEQLNKKIKRLQSIGVTHLECSQLGESPKSNNMLTVKHKHSGKDTWISERLSEREDP